MRLWHYKLIPYLPKSQLQAQWRELNSIFKKQDNHILINYVYEYSKDYLLVYTKLVLNEMKRRGMRTTKNTLKIADDFFGVDTGNYPSDINPFERHHNNRYLKQCFYNLQEKYDRGQKDFDDETYFKLEQFVNRCVNIGE